MYVLDKGISVGTDGYIVGLGDGIMDGLGDESGVAGSSVGLCVGDTEGIALGTGVGRSEGHGLGRRRRFRLRAIDTSNKYLAEGAGYRSVG